MQSTYGNLIDSLSCDIGSPSSGSIVRNESKGYEYNQHRISYAGNPLSLSIKSKHQAHQEGWAERRRLISILVASGVNAPDKVASKTFELLDAIGCFSYQKAILVGSHAFNAIGNNLGVTWDAGFETRDIDLG